MRGHIRIGLVCATTLVIAACGGDDGRDDAGPGILTQPSTDDDGGSTSGVTTQTGSADGGSTTGHDGTTSTDDEGGVLFDFGVPDAGDMPKGGIPQTCAEALQTQSSVGCSFHANKMQNFIEEPTSVVVGNVSETQPANVQLFWRSLGGGAESAVGAPVTVEPLETHEFVLSMPPRPGNVSVLRDGGAFRVESDVPIVAYQHSPISAEAHNDSSLLLPDHALGQYYIVAAWGTNIGGHNSAFNVVGVQDDTLVSWTPPVATSAGTGVPAVAAGATQSVTVAQYDMLQVIAATDVSGTIVETSKPAWVMGTVPCVNIPANVTFCDHIEELMIPLEYWGTEYVGAHAPKRNNESYWWRVYSGADGVTITTNPPQPGTPVTLDRGQFHEFSTKESFMFTGDGPFMPVQYLEGQNAGAGTGDPASYQMVPTEQFLPRYVFVTGTGYNLNYVQIIRPANGADVFVDGELVGGYEQVGSYQVADWPIAQGAHVASSTDPFGVIQVGYTAVTSYAYPGGLALGFINPNPAG
jgi:hypothetical protein